MSSSIGSTISTPQPVVLGQYNPTGKKWTHFASTHPPAVLHEALLAYFSKNAQGSIAYKGANKMTAEFVHEYLGYFERSVTIRAKISLYGEQTVVEFAKKRGEQAVFCEIMKRGILSSPELIGYIDGEISL